MAIDGSAHKVAGSALFEVSLGVRTDDRCVVERTYLHELDYTDFAAVVKTGSRSVSAPALVENICSSHWNKP